ncbi:AAA family ATPase [Nocardia huaxiensis]|uniref:AAA family ATPase n=1 Tax=Nocardia huaxiensis TaxID=2755382 RepID=A0A7D6VQ33_9NOCA|nr:AAA family ATPase [Nocardia huaxiensis]QLY34956.1 AAA family ATPase [Nocardia huaxiensis]UFT00153.1 AAA family ATPase [Nocardia huaxiensis]
MGVPELPLTARLNLSAADARRGVVRLHPETLTALGLRKQDGVMLRGARETTAVVAESRTIMPGEVWLDEVTLSNAGVRPDSPVRVSPADVQPARRIAVMGSASVQGTVPPPTLRRALLRKIVTVSDAVSLSPQDVEPRISSSTVTRELSRTIGFGWTNELLKVTATEPSGPVTVSSNTIVEWGLGISASPSHTSGDLAPVAAPATAPARLPTPTDLSAAAAAHDREAAPESAVAVADLAGVQAQAGKLTEWLQLALNRPDLLKTLGAPSHLGVLITGPAGVGKATLARAVVAQRRLIELDGPSIGATEGGSRLREVNTAVSAICDGGGGVLLITDIDALLPAEAEPVATLILDQLRAAVATKGVAMLVTTSNPAGVDPRLRGPDLCDREVSLPLPTAAVRAALLERLVRPAPTEGLRIDEIAARTPGFVVSDLAALVREAALRAALRALRAEDDPELPEGERREQSKPVLTQADLLGALEVIRPLSRSGSEELAVGGVSLEDVGDMVETKQALTEAVLWPLQHPDSFARLGIDPPRGVLLYGPPGCGKTFLVRALANTGQLSVHAVKGAELLDKWVGSSERAVRELFQRARDSAPSLIFLDEIDALAPRRGQATDAGVTDRIVATLLTEMDGVEPLRNVVVVGATNRPDLIDPALTRPGRLERLVFVPPPDAAARAEILRTAAKSVLLAKEVRLRKLAAELEGYSAADCAALLREAALAAMRRDIDADVVTAADVATARKAVRPSLDPVQVETLRLYAAQRAGSAQNGTASGYV